MSIRILLVLAAACGSDPSPPLPSPPASLRATVERDTGVPRIRCGIEPSKDLSNGTFWYEGSEAGISVWIFEGDAWIPARAGSSRGILQVVGHCPVRVEWRQPISELETFCSDRAVQVLPGDCAVGGKVISAAGDPIYGARIDGCGVEVRSGRDGSFRLNAIAEPCTLRAVWMTPDGREVAATMDAPIKPDPVKAISELVIAFHE